MEISLNRALAPVESVTLTLTAQEARVLKVLLMAVGTGSTSVGRDLVAGLRHGLRNV